MSKTLQISEIVIVITNESSKKNAGLIIEKILNQKLAACVNSRPVSSTFWWDGEIQSSEEIQLFIKTSINKLEQLLLCIKNMHTDKVPEIVFWSVSADKDYADWVNTITKSIC